MSDDMPCGLTTLAAQLPPFGCVWFSGAAGSVVVSVPVGAGTSRLRKNDILFPNNSIVLFS
jgi:hypothetical protein